MYNPIFYLGRILLVPSFFGRLLPFLVGIKLPFFWYCLPKPVDLEGLPDLLLIELEDFARSLVLMCFLSDTLA